MNFSQITDLVGLTNSRKEGTANAEKKILPNTEQVTLGPKEVYLSWDAEARPAQTGFNPKLTRTFIVIGVVVVLFFAILQEYFLILAIASIIFVTNVLAKTPSEHLHFEVSSHGLLYGEQLYYWSEMKRFFFFDQGVKKVMAIDLVSGPPSRLFVTIRTQDQEKLKGIFSKYMNFLETPPETIVDKTYKSIMSKFDTSGK